MPWTEEPGGLQSMGSQRVGHHWTTSTFSLSDFHIFSSLIMINFKPHLVIAKPVVQNGSSISTHPPPLTLIFDLWIFFCQNVALSHNLILSFSMAIIHTFYFTFFWLLFFNSKKIKKKKWDMSHGFLSGLLAFLSTLRVAFPYLRLIFSVPGLPSWLRQ